MRILCEKRFQHAKVREWRPKILRENENPTGQATISEDDVRKNYVTMRFWGSIVDEKITSKQGFNEIAGRRGWKSWECKKSWRKNSVKSKHLAAIKKIMSKRCKLQTIFQTIKDSGKQNISWKLFNLLHFMQKFREIKEWISCLLLFLFGQQNFISKKSF